jgi:DNA-binding NarL/FixJ family response regulator
MIGRVTGQIAMEARTTRPRVLIVDDHVALLQEVARVLEREFVVAALVCDAETLMMEWPDVHPDVIVLDISLPGCSGFEAADRLRDAGCETPIVFLSVHEAPEFVQAAWAADGTAYVAKRDLGRDLVSAVWSALDGRRFISAAIARRNTS